MASATWRSRPSPASSGAESPMAPRFAGRGRNRSNDRLANTLLDAAQTAAYSSKDVDIAGHKQDVARI